MQRSRRPWFSCALQLAFLIGGLGYLLRREWRKALGTFLAVSALEGVVLAASLLDNKALSAVACPLIFSVQLMSALDLWTRNDRAPAEDPAGAPVV